METISRQKDGHLRSQIFICEPSTANNFAKGCKRTQLNHLVASLTSSSKQLVAMRMKLLFFCFCCNLCVVFVIAFLL